ncbi:type II toxin-antitoxin system RelE/ParE family toxin [Novosphingobium sp. NBM11]|uniref:type II toxin-antitoxin system RelE/ParE family toxin n=1 Tax=Novosphingobium sp. NBM11 TaxID=2596914 RepID=UPI0028150238|nr:type II toxin-antitoxin system RelE/ParE family toxin [Novosphingobium sp. NBM11]
MTSKPPGAGKTVAPNSNVSYKGQSFQLSETPDFSGWLGSLRDRRARARIVVRLERLADGNLGDCKSLKDGVHELRIDYGPGYRVYFFQRGKELVILLCGGDKRTQKADIASAKRLKEEIERSDGTSSI